MEKIRKKTLPWGIEIKSQPPPVHLGLPLVIGDQQAGGCIQHQGNAIMEYGNGESNHSPHPNGSVSYRLDLALALAATDSQWQPQVEARLDEYSVWARDHQRGLTRAPSIV